MNEILLAPFKTTGEKPELYYFGFFRNKAFQIIFLSHNTRGYWYTISVFDIKGDNERLLRFPKRETSADEHRYGDRMGKVFCDHIWNLLSVTLIA